MTDWNRADARTLRMAVLDPDGLIPLIQADPGRGAELVLATMLVEPRKRGVTGLDDGIGIINRIDARAALPENGPMLGFFLNAPDPALDTILKIVDHATDGWAQSEWVDVSDEPVTSFEVLLDGERVALAGNANVMHWHRGDARVPKPLATALMALEAFLYRKLDAGEDITDLLTALMASRSVAIWGVLVDVACYAPALIKGPLSPLVSSAGLLMADRLYKSGDHTHLLMTFDEGERRQLTSWHEMDHRKQPLDELVLRAVVAGGQLVEELAAGRAIWAEDPENRWRFLVAQMDPANYQEVEIDSEGVRGWQYVEPDEIRTEIEAGQHEHDMRMSWLTAPVRLRQWVDSGQRVNDEHAEALWTSVQAQLAADAPDDIFEGGVLRRADVECGAAAALLACAPEWSLARDEVVAFCREAAIRPFADPPPTHPFDSSEELTDKSWDGFAATALPLLWARFPEDLELREAVVRLAIHPHRNSVRRFFLNASRISSLVPDVRRLEVVALHWARCRSWLSERRHRTEQAEYWPDAPKAEDLPDLRPQTEGVLTAFVDGTLSAESPDLRAFIDATPAGMVNPSAPARHRLAMSLDVSYLLAAYSHVLSLADEIDQDERTRRFALAGQFADILAETLRVEGERELRGTPAQEEYHLLGRLGTMAATGDSAQARRIWQPILTAGSPAHYWVSWFINDIWRAGLAADSPPPRFAELIKEMMTFAAGLESWRGPWRDELELALLCLNRFGHPRMDERHRELLAALQPEWAELAASQMSGAYSALSVVRFLSDPVAVDLATTGLDWLVAREAERACTSDELDSATAEFLVNLVARDPQTFRDLESARQVLAALVARQQPVALQLSAQLSGGG